MNKETLTIHLYDELDSIHNYATRHRNCLGVITEKHQRHFIKIRLNFLKSSR